MNGRESPRDTILNEPVLRLIRVLVSDWAQKKSEASICRTAFVIFLYEGVYLQTRLFAIPVWLLRGSFLREEFFSENGAHKTEDIP